MAGGNMLIDGILVEADCSISEDEVIQIVAEERVRFLAANKVLGRLELKINNNEIVIHAWSKEPIRRVRRITGYLSTIDSFNDAKQAELKARVTHGF